MIRSMTGFGKASEHNESHKIDIELKSVNHRYLDLSIKMPKRFNEFEADIRNELKKHIQRGKVDLYITYEAYESGAKKLRYNSYAVAEYMEYAKQIEQEFGLCNDLRISSMLRLPEVITAEEGGIDTEQYRKLLLEVLGAASEKFVEARRAEGENLKADMLVKLEEISYNLALIEARAPEMIREYEERLKSRLEELLSDKVFDENRVLTEVALFADRTAIDEEIVRLKSHIDAAKKELQKGGAVGRKLDFIAQEMNRESNTILSKATGADISEKAISIKTDIEKLREQIQNIE